MTKSHVLHYAACTLLFAGLLNSNPLFVVSAYAQSSPLFYGELQIHLINGSSPYPTAGLYRDVNPPYGSYCYDYPVFTGYDYQTSSGGNEWGLAFVDRLYHCPPEALSQYMIGYGKYKLIIQGHFIYVDYRDADYGHGDSIYSGHEDLHVDYDLTSAQFKKHNTQTVITYGSTYAIWDPVGKEGPRVPITVTCATGYVLVNGTSHASPFQDLYDVGLSDWFAAYNPTTGEQGDHYTLNISVDNFATVLDFPAAPTGVSISGAIGQHPTISWSANRRAIWPATNFTGR